MDLIERIRQKPKKVRTQIALITSAAITLLIFGLWATVLNFNLSVGSQSASTTAAVGNTKDVDPVSSFGQVISNGWGSLMDNINQGKGQIKNTFSSSTLSTSTSDFSVQ